MNGGGPHQRTKNGPPGRGGLVAGVALSAQPKACSSPTTDSGTLCSCHLWSKPTLTIIP